ncbi:uncharacterized protein B0I36DRAFT_326668 [Microdochium trichocladiopsis]|uniref:Uncharacterized protein n=1 Tax=Microdochium trichocladiopsis TaxID=1682393 RepID=A0A9P8Y114_9PEZI|nr:uncharacterized protein B0I36DRAFT_326668 [Microdochium trichocladiopsis]KAH7027210.1 hypothetical protein B0I36DRAFT_326668 [Microdochium trichocladiopsis]
MASPLGGARLAWATDSVMLHHDPRSYREPEPLSARIIGILFTLFTAGACATLFSQRVAAVKSWSRLPYIRWLVILQYAGAFVYTIFSSVVQYGFHPDDDPAVCNASAAVCVMLYAIMKGLLYLFLADRLHVVRSTVKGRKQSRLFLFHTIGIAFCIVVLAAVFIYLRLHYIENGVCIIGVQRVMMVIGVIFDALINIYLTGFFLFYLSKSFNLQPFKSSRGVESLGSGERPNPLAAEINKLTKRTTIGLGITLIATITNLATITIMDGEVLWLCFLTCKADILLCVLVLHYMASSGRQARQQFSTTERTARPPSAQTDRPASPKANSIRPGGNQRLPDLGGLEMDPAPVHLIEVDAIINGVTRSMRLQKPHSIHGNNRGNISNAV